MVKGLAKGIGSCHMHSDGAREGYFWTSVSCDFFGGHLNVPVNTLGQIVLSKVDLVGTGFGASYLWFYRLDLLTNMANTKGFTIV